MVTVCPKNEHCLNNPWPRPSIEKVKSAKKLFVLGLVAFWVLVTNHCRLENIPGFAFLACETPVDASPHQPSDCGDEDACADVESGLYKSEDNYVAGKRVELASAPFAFALNPHIPSPELATKHIPPESVPQELAHTWQFSFRTALSPRAPSVIS